MNKQIPIYFDSVVVSSPFQEIAGNSSIGRLKVRAFTKYGNRNGSYITDQVADMLIKSATQGMTPVIGFFDPESKSWASHTGPTLANAYGYVENFEGWEPFTDTDGIVRDYAVFSVVLFTDYFEEAKNILGQNQSMELDPNSIQGDWALIDENEYFVYTTAKMLGFCVIGSHQPCFSVSSFFSKNDDDYTTQYEKFSSLLFDLKARVEEAEKGGEKPMDELEKQEQVNPEETPAIEEEVAVEPVAPVEEQAVEEEAPAAETSEEDNEPSEFDLLKQQFEDLQNSYNELQNNYNNALTRINELEQFQTTANGELETLRTKNAELQTSISSYEEAATALMEQKKNELVEKYEKIIKDAEEITVIKASLQDFSYDELESKLAIIFANQQMQATSPEEKVLLPDPPESQFALLMKKYRKK